MEAGALTSAEIALNDVNVLNARRAKLPRRNNGDKRSIIRLSNRLLEKASCRLFKKIQRRGARSVSGFASRVSGLNSKPETRNSKLRKRMRVFFNSLPRSFTWLDQS